MSKWTRYFYALIVFALLYFNMTTLIYADAVTILSDSSGFAVDGSFRTDYQADGYFETWEVLGFVWARKYDNPDDGHHCDYRGFYTFRLPDVLQNWDVTINSAILVTTVTEKVSDNGNLLFYGFEDDSTTNVADMNRDYNLLGSIPISNYNGQYDVTGLFSLIQLPDEPSGLYVSFLMDVDEWGAKVEMESQAELIIDYTITPTNRIPTVSISSPDPIGPYYTNVPIHLSATASDKEDGDITENIVWSRNGTIIPGGAETDITLTQATYTSLKATVEDSEGGIGNAYVSFNVYNNGKPKITISSPANGESFVEGETIVFSATASDDEDGNLSNRIYWRSDIQGFIGYGSPFMTPSVNEGLHIIEAKVTDSLGAVTKEYFDIEVLPLIPGDIDRDGELTLVDAILSLQLASGTQTSLNINKYADVNGDIKIGIAETIYILQELSSE